MRTTRSICSPASRRRPMRGKAPFALWHFSEDPSLALFGSSHTPAYEPVRHRRSVRGVDTRHAPMFWFPRDCPRGCICPVTATTPQDRERFFGQSAATRIHVMEAGWLPAHAGLPAVCVPDACSRCSGLHEVGGYWVADEPVEAVEQVIVDDLAGRHAAAGIELRITLSIWPFWRRVADSTVEFSVSDWAIAPLIRTGSGSARTGDRGLLACPRFGEGQGHPGYWRPVKRTKQGGRRRG